MIVKRIEPQLEENVPELDEGWWTAILSEEDETLETIRDGNWNGMIPEKMAPVDWERVRSVHENDEIITLNAVGYNRGGLLVQGSLIQGFIPVSHLVDMPCGTCEDEREKILNDYIGKKLRLKVIEFEQTHDRIVFSERAALAGEGQRKRLLQNLKPGDTVTGIVTNVTEFGVFVDLGGLEGLIHVSELSWGRVKHPKFITEVGQCVKTMVLQVNEGTARVALSIKRLQDNPWDTFANSCQIGDIVPATITNIMRFGAFAKLEYGIEGLIHNSSINFKPGQESLEDICHIGQSLQVRILHLDGERRRLGLGLVVSE